MEAVRTHGGDAYPDPTHNPFVNNDPAQGLNATVLNQWEGWIAALESQHVAVFFILYDDHADPFGGSTVGVAERAFIHGLIDRFENHTNIIWCVAEEYPDALVPSRVSSIAAEIRAADDHAHPIAIHQATGDNTMDFPNDPNIDQFAQQSNATTPTGLHTAVLTAFNDAAGRFNVNMAEDLSAHKDDLLLGRRQPCRKRNWATAMAGGYFMVLGAWETTTGGAVPPAAWLADWGRQVSFFESTNFNEMMPRDDLRFGGTTYVLAKPGESYIAYAPALAGSLGLKGMTAGTYDLRWLDAATGTMVSQTGVIVGQGDQTWVKPATIGAELALYIRRQGVAPPPPPPQAVVSSALIDADLDVDIGPLQNGDTLNLSTLPTRHLNVRANTSPSPVGSVRFALDANGNYRTENTLAYSLAGDTGGNYVAWTPSVGSHTLAATPYTGANATGTVGTPLTVTFTVVQ